MIPLAISLLFSLFFAIFFPFSLSLLFLTLLIFCLFLGLAAIKYKYHQRIAFLIMLGILIGSSLIIPQLINYQKAFNSLPTTANTQFIINKIYPSSKMVEATIISPSEYHGYAIQIYNIGNVETVALGETYKAQLTIQPNRAKATFHKINPRITHLVNHRIGTANLKDPLILIQSADTLTSMRTNIADYIEQQNFKNADLMSALSVGLTNKISQSTWELLRQTGVIHLVSISGLHLTFLALWCFIILRSLLGLCMIQNPAPYRIAAVTSLIIAIGYALIAGMSLPTQRALIMFGIFIIVLLARYPILNLYSLATALLVVLIISPFSVVTIGLWLSFTAVLILMLLGRYQLSFIVSLLLTQIIISALAIPIVVSFFNEASLISPAANLFAIPWATLLILPFLLLGILILPISSVVGTALLELSDYNITVLLNFLHVMNTIPLSHIELPYISLLSAIILTILSVLMLTKVQWLIKSMCLIGILCICFYIFKPDKNEYLLVFPVGQGLSALLKSQEKTLLFDTGPYFRGFDSAKTTIIPTLKSMNIHTLDNIILSHDNQQHIGGTRSIRRNFPDAQVILHQSLKPMIYDSMPCQNYSFEQKGLIIQPLTTYKSCAFMVNINGQIIWLIANITPAEWNKLLQQNPKPNAVLFPNKGRSKGYKIPKNWDDIIFIGSTKNIHSEYSHHKIYNAYYGAIKLNISANGLTVESASDKEIFWWAHPIETI